MASQILACLALSFLSAGLACAAEFRFYPVNVCPQGEACTDGLTFYFENITESRVNVTVTALQNGKPVIKTQAIDTSHRRDTDPVFHMRIDPASRHDLIELKIETGGRVYRFPGATSGKAYRLGEET